MPGARTTVGCRRAGRDPGSDGRDGSTATPARRLFTAAIRYAGVGLALLVGLAFLLVAGHESDARAFVVGGGLLAFLWLLVRNR